MATTFPRTMSHGLGGSLQRGTSAFGPWVTSDPYDYQLRDQSMTSAPAFPPFKFESRRARIDWRLLHGIDINEMMRDVDLDTLEKIVNIVAFGDIEAEDTRHLTELNFIKIFRLSQMMIEYLLYVQDCLQNSNSWLQQNRANLDKYVQAARLRIRELEANLKMNKRELRRSRKTIKTYELLAALNDGKSLGIATMASMATVPVPASPPPQPQAPQVPQVVKQEPNPVNLAMEALLRKELAVLGDRLSKATLECQTLRFERDELYQAVKDLETVVKARGLQSGVSSPPAAHVRQNADALHNIQGLQDQLNRATVEITKLRNEKTDLSEDLERANAERRQLQNEKSRLLSELAARPGDLPRGATESPHGSENLSSMLLEADRQKAAVQDELSEAKVEIAALQKQLMKAMKATALGTLPQPPPPPTDERLVRELEATRAQLERELADTRRNYSQDMRQLQENLEAAQAKAEEAEYRLSEIRATQRDNSGRMSPPQTGGFIKIVEERRGDSPPDEDLDVASDRNKALLAEYEATNERLNQQLIQIKGERNTLAGEVEQLRVQLQNKPSPSQGDRSISRDWRTEEIERLTEERDAAQRRILDLEDALQDRDAMVDRLRTTVRELQAQLAELDRQQANPPPFEPSLVKQQVKHFNRLTEPGKSVRLQSSFSFTGELPADSATTSVDTPTSFRRPATIGVPEITTESLPPRPPSRSPSPIPEETEAEVTPMDDIAPLSLQQPRQPQKLAERAGWLQRIPRPSPGDAALIQQELMRRVAGLGPEALEMMLQDEIRVITENPYEYADDEEERFQLSMPHEMAERKGVRSVDLHSLEDLATARSLYTHQLLAVLDDEIAQYGVDPSSSMLSDKAYLACMQELSDRRSRMLQRYPKELQDRAEDLRSFLLTHIEILKRTEVQQRRLQMQEQLQQQVQQQKAQSPTARVRSSNDTFVNELEPSSPGASAPPAGLPGPAALSGDYSFRQVSSSSRDPLTRSSSLTPGGLSAAAAAASRPLTTVAAGTAEQQPLPMFPSQQSNLQRSSNPGAKANAEEPRGSLLPVLGGSIPTSGPLQQATSSQSTAVAQGASGVPSPGRTQLSRETSTAERQTSHATRDGDGVEQQPVTVISRMQRSSSGSSDRTTTSHQMSLPHSGTSTRSQATAPAAASPAATAQPATALTLARQATPSSPERITLGPAKPTVLSRSLAAVAPTQGGNMNTSIRSVKYQESDFDDDDDEMPLPQPKPVRRVAEEDEYTLTEDEEAQQDMGLEDCIEDFSKAQQPKILLAAIGKSSSPQTAVLSRLGMQPTPATAQARGWGMDEPLQQVPTKRQPSQQASEAVEMELLDSIQAFDTPTSQSSTKHSPGAWSSPSATMRKNAVQGGREPSAQDVTEPFNDNRRPMVRLMGQQGPVAGASLGTTPQPRIITRHDSFSSDVSDLELA